MKVYSDKKTRLWSFEVKVLINCSNIREVFFQTTRNSSWENYSHLVADEITGNGTLRELQMLTNLHNTGVIKLDIEHPAKSQILLRAGDNTEIDPNTTSRIAEEKFL